jgi:hypothetical protein
MDAFPKAGHDGARARPNASVPSIGRPKCAKSWLRIGLRLVPTESTRQIWWVAGEIGVEVAPLATRWKKCWRSPRSSSGFSNSR